MQQRGSVAVIVPIRNEERYIAATLDQLLDQDRTGVELEILVIDGQSDDRTRDIVAQYVDRYPEVRLLDNPGRLSSSARNIGIAESTGEYLVVIDGHCEIPSRTYFVDLLDAFARTGADCLGRPQPLDVRNASPLQRAIAAARSSRLGHHPDSFIYSADEVDCPAQSVAVAYRRSVFDQIGLFDERFDACEDCELNHRIDQAGLRCTLVPKLAVRYEPRDSLKGLFYQLFRYGRGRARLFLKHRDTLSLGTVIPGALVLGTLVGPILAVTSPTLGALYAAALVSYFISIALTSLATLKAGQPLGVAIRMPAVFVAIHYGVGIGFLRELLLPARKPTGMAIPRNRPVAQRTADAK
ncbi:glycosyltransferase [Pirellulales bacterium]|nr:glycosyltransferase [Pirellulales bacterium]